MKKIVVSLMMLLVAGSTFAKSHGPAGCGLGAVLFKDKEGLVFNVLAATFNGTSGNQTFGMSTGTLGCEDAQTATVTAVSFVEANQVALSNDIARGQGQTLDAYLVLIGHTNASKKVLQQNFERIFAKENSAQKIHSTILSVING